MCRAEKAGACKLQNIQAESMEFVAIVKLPALKARLPG